MPGHSIFYKIVYAYMHLAITQTCESVQSDKSSQDTLWKAKEPKSLQADNEDSHQAALMR